jgi:hypothetical protein
LWLGNDPRVKRPNSDLVHTLWTPPISLHSFPRQVFGWAVGMSSPQTLTRDILTSCSWPSWFWQPHQAQVSVTYSMLHSEPDEWTSCYNALGIRIISEIKEIIMHFIFNTFLCEKIHFHRLSSCSLSLPQVWKNKGMLTKYSQPYLWNFNIIH